MMPPLNNKSESGYTLQTLIIIAILVLATTTASVLLYAVLRDSTSRIAGGSETFDGLPGGPQNLRVVSKPSVTDPADVDVTISWEAPSYLGEFPPTGYELSINEDGNKMRDNRDDPPGPLTWGPCPLDISDPDFTYDNECKATIPSIEISNTSLYELVFTIKLGSASGGTSPGGLTFYRELSLSTDTPLPNPIQVMSLPDAVELSWDAETDVVYRLHIEIPGPPVTNYYQCFVSVGGKVTREVPNIRSRTGTENNTTLRQGTEYTIKISASESVLTPLNNAECADDGNFGDSSADITATFGTPSDAEITFTTGPDHTVRGKQFASLRATLSSCESEMNTVFYWQEAGKPGTQGSQTISGCGSTPNCTSDCEITVYDDFTLNTEYEVWTVTANDFGVNSPSRRQQWIPATTATPGEPSPPRNIETFSGSYGIIISWNVPEFLTDSGIKRYVLRSQAKPASGNCPATPSNAIDLSPSISQYTFSTAENHQTYCFQLTAVSLDSNQDELSSPAVNFEAAHVDPITVVTDEFRLNWKSNPRAEYYAIDWAPLTEAKDCAAPFADLVDADLQPPQFLSATIQPDGNDALSYTIHALNDLYYLLNFKAVSSDGNIFSWSGYVCAGKNAPPVSMPAWTGTTTAGGAVGLEWTKPELNAYNYDNRNSSFSYALRITDPGGTTTDQCIAFGDSTVPETTANGITTVSYEVASSSVAGNYSFSLTVAPTSDCGSSAQATGIITSPPTAAPPVRTDTRTIM